jgi:hypothetical protein
MTACGAKRTLFDAKMFSTICEQQTLVAGQAVVRAIKNI